MVITFRDVINKGKCLLGGRVKKDMNLEQALELYACLLQDLQKNTDLSSVYLKKLGITETCKLKAKNMLSEILNTLVATDEDFATTLAQLNQQVQNINTNTGNSTDEKVKTSEADTVAGYLADKIVSPQTGAVSVVGNQIQLMGFAPLGSVMYIDAGRIGDFDATGKGKANTDVWGWALSNGENGTRNRLGKFPRYAPTNADAGKTGGANEVALTSGNIPGMEFPVTGTIAEALTAPIQGEIRLEANKIADGSGGSVYLLRVGDGQNGHNHVKTLPFDVKHAHTFDLKSKFDNPAPTKIATVPEYLYEIPIQRINP